MIPPGWRPTHRHVKRGFEYEWLGYGRTQSESPMADFELVSIYRDKSGQMWARRSDEFFDGRFEVLPTASPPLPEVGDETVVEAIARSVEEILFDRTLRRRLEGYTLEASKEIARAIISVLDTGGRG